MAAEKHFHLIVPVWGKSYTALFTEVCLPMIMTPGNIGALGGYPGDQFVIVTTWEDHLAIKSSASYERLSSMIAVEFILTDGFVDLGNTHLAMSNYYAMAMRRKSVVAGKTYFLFLTPDSFWPDGMFRRLAELAEQGFKVVMAGGLRVKSEPMSGILRKRIEQSPDNPAIPLPELTRLALANIHQMSTAFNLLSPQGFLNAWPSHMYWINEKDQQLIAHCFHLHPLLVLAPRSVTAIGTTIDGQFLDNLHYPLEQYYVIQNEGVAIELTPAERNWGVQLQSPSLRKIVLFALSNANSRHWHFFEKRIVLNGKPEKSTDPLLDKLIEKTTCEIRSNKRWAVLTQTFHLSRPVWVIGRISSILGHFFRKLISR
jgi:hypothetical protein